MTELTVVREFTNLTAKKGENDQYILFLGKNNKGEEAAEILNQLQEDGKLMPMNNQKLKRRGFYRISYNFPNPSLIEDLHEATSGGEGTLCGPQQRPVVFVRRVITKESDKATIYDKLNDYYFFQDENLAW